MSSLSFDNGGKHECHLFNTSDIKALSQWREKERKNWSATTIVVFEILDSRLKKKSIVLTAVLIKTKYIFLNIHIYILNINFLKSDQICLKIFKD